MRRASSDDDFVALPGDLQIARTLEKDHRARVLIDGRLVRDLFDINIEQATGGKIDGLGVHQVAFEENFDPVALFSNGENDAGSVFDRRDQFFVFHRLARQDQDSFSLPTGLAHHGPFYPTRCAAATRE